MPSASAFVVSIQVLGMVRPVTCSCCGRGCAPRGTIHGKPVYSRSFLGEVLCDSCIERSVEMDTPVPEELKTGFQFIRVRRRLTTRPKRLNQRQIYAEFSMPHRFDRSND